MASLIKTRVLFFGGLKDLFHCHEMDFQVPAGTCVKQAWRLLFKEGPQAERLARSVLFAVNQTYAEPETELKEGDELALIPPVAGG